jgi:hypothetical protein
MPHDDDFPRGWVDTLLRHLEAEPDLLMAFGRVEPVATAEAEAGIQRYRHPPVGTGAGTTWTVHDAVAVLRLWRGGYAFRGMFRRAPVVTGGLFLPRTRDGIDADAAWVFGMALLGRLRYVPEVSCSKRYYAGSEHSIWQRRMVHQLSLARVLAGYALRYGGSPGARLRALAALPDYMLMRLAWGTSRRARLVRRLRRVGRRMLRPRARPRGAGDASPS